ncbi:MAG: hypothetical protein IPK81_09960 [Rhodospirillales bacterium]|nr:MAG: hypothetical protein IPK81_09960 [Rhodospirillales bacterium]
MARSAAELSGRVAAAFAVAASCVAAGAAAAQTPASPSIQIELPDKRVVRLDQAPGVRSRLAMPISRWSKTPDWMSRTITMFGAAAPFCPPLTTWTLDAEAARVETARRDCERQMRERLAEYAQADRDRCACAVVVSGRPAERLRVSSETFAGPALYDTAIVAVTRAGAATQTMLGFRVNQGGESRLHNADRQLVCSSRSAGAGKERTYSCFGGRVTAKGSQREIREEEGERWRFYTMGRFELANGERIDFVTNLTGPELRKRHPTFPD